MLVKNQLKLAANENINIDNIKKALAKNLNISENELTDIKIIKQSIDARKKPEIYYIFSVIFNLKNKKYQDRLLNNKKSNVSIYKKVSYTFPQLDKNKIEENLKKFGRPVIIGSGPAGYMCAYKLAQAGLKPIVIERGEDVDKRLNSVNKFWETNSLNLNSNIQFGEGGAGTFSDGKLATGVNDKYGRIEEILKIYVKNGATDDILYLTKPHIGTDILTKVVKNMRKFTEDNEGEVRFNSVFKRVDHKDNMLTNAVIENLETNEEYSIKCDNLVIATGHSSRDTYRALHNNGLLLSNKPFAVGFRVQHSQSTINQSQYGNIDYELPAADYKLTYTSTSGRGVYSFCMCPGGYVVNSSSESERLAVNGMSYHARDGINANSAIVITVDENTYGSDLFDGMLFQEEIEKKAYEAGHGNIPLQLLGDFKNNIPTTKLGRFAPAIKGEYSFANLRDILTEEMNADFIEAFSSYGNTIKGFNDDDAILCGVESRTSAPLKI